MARTRWPGLLCAFALTACGGGGGGGGGGSSDSDWYYHFICNGDSGCLSTNFAGAPSGTSNQGPGEGGQAGCSGLMNFGNINWNIPPAQQWCDHTPDLSDSPFPTATISVSPSPVVQDETATVTWSSTKATSCTASGAWTGAKALSGNQNVTQANTGNYTYTINCSNASGNASDSATLTVNAAPPGVQLSASPAAITVGQSATLTWVSYQYTTCTASGPWSGSKALNGNEIVTPSAAGTFSYTLSCQSAVKGSGSGSATLTVNPASGPLPTAPTVSLSASNEYPSCMDTGAQNTLTWSSTNATSCTASGSWTGSTPTSGTQNIYPGAASNSSNSIIEYVLNCSGPGGSASDTAKLCVVPANSGTPPPVTLSFTVTPTAISLGESATLDWTSQYASSCTAADDWSGLQSLSGTRVVTPSSSRGYLYTLTCQNYVTGLQKQVQIGVGPPSGNVPLAARFNLPVALAIDSADTLWIADSQNHTIRRITTGGTVSTVAGLAATPGSTNGLGASARFNYPGGVSVGTDGKVVVADTANWTMRGVDTGTNVTTLAGTVGAAGGSVDGTGADARFVQPRHVSIDSSGNAYVADYGGCAIRKVTPEGVVTTVGGVMPPSCGTTDGAAGVARMGGVMGVVVTNSGDLYTTDYVYHTIRKVAPNGTVTTIAGTAGVAGSNDATGATASFYLPYGIDVDSQGNLFVAEHGNRKIRKVTPAGVVTTFAGSGDNASTDGTGTGASFFAPTALAIDSADNVYVTDGCAIRKITPAAVVTTYAGNAAACGSNN